MLFTEFAGIEILAVKLRVFVNARDIPVKQSWTGNKRSKTAGCWLLAVRLSSQAKIMKYFHLSLKKRSSTNDK
jgi:hypothetical protein